MLLLPGDDCKDFALACNCCIARSRNSASHMYWSDSIAMPMSRALEHLLAFEQEKAIVISTSGEKVTIKTPSQTADLLRMTSQSCEEFHAAMPIEKISLLFCWPFNRIKVDITHFIAYEKLFRGGSCSGLSERLLANCIWTEADTRHWRRLLAVEPWISVKRTPQRDATICAANGKDCAASLSRAERNRSNMCTSVWCS